MLRSFRADHFSLDGLVSSIVTIFMRGLFMSLGKAAVFEHIAACYQDGAAR